MRAETFQRPAVLGGGFNVVLPVFQHFVQLPRALAFGQNEFGNVRVQFGL